MSKIFVIDNTSGLTFDDLKSKPIGASEFQFYNLIFEISKYKNIICYNKISNEIENTNIKYKNISNIYNENFDESDIIIIQRLFPEINILKLFKNNKIYITLHDYDFNAVIFQFQKINNNKDKEYILNYINKNNNINFIFNSEFTKKYFNVNFLVNNMTIESDRKHVIYNVLYEDFFIKNKNKNVNKKNLVYASGWNKGIQKIVELFEYILLRDESYKLILMSPGYEYERYKDYALYLKNRFPNNIIIYGPVNKLKYCEIIENSGCVLAPSFPETFGCVFSESYYLGTPVICDIKSGAVKEIIGNENIVNYNNKDEVYNKILFKTNSNEIIQLDSKFLLDYNLNIWKKLIFLS